MAQTKEQKKEYYLKNKEYFRFKQEQYRKNNTAEYLHSAVKSRAKSRGIPFNIDVSDIVIPDFCPIFSWLELKRGTRGFCDTSPSLDKIIPELGYIKGNVQVISYKANKMKSNGTFKELVALGKWAERHGG